MPMAIVAGPRAKATEADPPWPPESPDSPWPPLSPDPQWPHESPDLPWPPDSPDPPWPPEKASSAMASWSALEALLVSTLFQSCTSLQSAPPPPRWYCYGAGHAFQEGGDLSRVWVPVCPYLVWFLFLLINLRSFRLPVLINHLVCSFVPCLYKPSVSVCSLFSVFSVWCYFEWYTCVEAH